MQTSVNAQNQDAILANKFQTFHDFELIICGHFFLILDKFRTGILHTQLKLYLWLQNTI